MEAICYTHRHRSAGHSDLLKVSGAASHLRRDYCPHQIRSAISLPSQILNIFKDRNSTVSLGKYFALMSNLNPYAIIFLLFPLVLTPDITEKLGSIILVSILPTPVVL